LRMEFQEVDQLFDDAEYDKIIEVLSPRKDEINEELYWRLARALFQKSKTLKSDGDKKKMLQEAMELVERGTKLNINNYIYYKWSSILLDATSRLEGIKERIIQSEKVKQLMERAVELNPNDPTCYHVLGVWCFTCADLPWVQRKVAAAIFSDPPTSTFEEALKFFEKAEEITPGWYRPNQLMLGKTYSKLNNKEKAIEFLTKCRDAPIKDEDDRESHKEAVDLLKSMGVKK